MDDKDKLKLLKSLYLLANIPEDQLKTLSAYLKPETVEDGGMVFEEGTKGDSLYFISSGQIKITKKIVGKAPKDLAILSAGDCFGEMALVDSNALRSASASAEGKVVLFKLGLKDMKAWLKSKPQLAVGFFAELVQIQTKRLRRTSTELALLYDLSNLLLEPIETGKELLTRVIEHVIPHLQGSWSSAAYLYNIFNDEVELIEKRGSFDFATLDKKLPDASANKSLWLDETNFYVSLPGEKRAQGFLVFHSHSPVSNEDRTDNGRTLTTMSRLTATALSNIEFKSDELLRQRLRSSQEQSGSRF